MTELDAQRAMFAYAKLENGAIDEIDAAMFTGDMFMVQSNRIDFYAMMDRWDKQLKVWEETEKNYFKEDEQ